jgi:hypothetical protein
LQPAAFEVAKTIDFGNGLIAWIERQKLLKATVRMTALFWLTYALPPKPKSEITPPLYNQLVMFVRV